MVTVTRTKRVVLFGRTGDGKSTVANVLVTGGIEPVVFPSSDGARGCTSSINTKGGNGWEVTDTVGLGEAEVGTISNTDAKNMLTGFLKDVRGEYSHIIYVQRASRLTTVDEMIWLLFSQIFEGAEEAFVVLFTGANEQWLKDNEAKLPAYLRDQHVLVTDIPPKSKRPVSEKRLKKIREESIRKLVADLETNFNERGQRNSVPQIANMTESQLETKSKSLLDFIIQQIQRLFDRAAWLSVALKIATVVNVTGIVIDLISMAL